MRATRSEISVLVLRLVLAIAVSAILLPASYALPPVSVPFVQSLSPISATPGGDDFTLTVNGANFASTSQVFWGSTALVTTFVSTIQLTAIVPAALTATGGTGWITVLRPASQVSNVVFFPVIASIPSLTLVESTNGGADGSWGAIQGDFNKDGKLDVVTSNREGGSVTVFLGNGDGTFQTGQVIPVFIGPFGLAVGDVNNDGNLDVVVTSLLADGVGGIAVLLGKGDGTFQAPAISTNDAGASETLALADVNRDGRLDLLVGSMGVGGIQVFLGNGDGTFQAPVGYGASLGNIDQVLVADMNGDGSLDLVMSNEEVVAVMLGNGDGTFQTATSSSAQVSLGIVIADFDRDGKLDVVASSAVSGIFFLKGNGDGTLQAATTVGAGADFALQAGDFNGDGKMDLVTENDVHHSVDFYAGNGDGTFQAVQSFGTNVGRMFTFAAGNFVTGGGLTVAAADGGSNMLFFQPAVTVSPTSLVFDSAVTGSTSAIQTVTVTNGTPVSVNITQVAVLEAGSSVDFQQETTTCTGALAASASCTIDVTFSPTVVGALTATLQVFDDATGSPQTVALSGIATAPVGPTATLSASLLTFAASSTGVASASQIVTLTNSGGIALTITSIGLTGANPGDFMETNTCSDAVAVSAACTITVTFTPTAGGARTAAVTLTDSAVGSPQAIQLSGTGEDFALAFATNTQTVMAGATASFQLGVTPLGGFTAPIMLTCTGAPVNSTCTVTPNVFTPEHLASKRVTPNGGGVPVTITVALITQAATLAPLPAGGPGSGAPFAMLRIAFLLGGIGLLLLIGWPRRRVSIGRMAVARFACVFAGAILLATFGLAGCGSTKSTKSTATKSGSYTLTVTGTSGTLSHSLPVTVIVQ